jgi:hypothetical protein
VAPSAVVNQGWPVRLPASGREVVLRPLTGADEILLLEADGEVSPDRGGLLDLALALAARLSDGAETGTSFLEDLPVPDLEALLLRLRQRVFGDAVRSDIVCPAVRPDGTPCRTRIDIAFSTSDYLDHHAPDARAIARRAAPADDAPGWYRLPGDDEPAVRFRPPTVGDLKAALAAEGGVRPDRALLRRCCCVVSGAADAAMAAALPARLRRRIEAAMEAIAPALSRALPCRCPECGAETAVSFDVLPYCLGELRAHAAFVYDDVHRLASAYGWTEAEILTLPSARRARYVDRVRQATAAPVLSSLPERSVA